MLRVTYYLLLASTIIWLPACQHRPAYDRPLLRAHSYRLKVDPAKRQLKRQDLIEIACRYGIRQGEKPRIEELLELNRDCRPEAKEELSLGSQTTAAHPCQAGWLLVPIAENRPSPLGTEARNLPSCPAR